MSTLATIPGDVWRRPTLGLMIVGSGILRPLCLFNASIVVIYKYIVLSVALFPNNI
jgi:hypothetical protein